MDPDGRKIFSITSGQHQNSSENNNLDIGGRETGYFKFSEDTTSFILNKVGPFGCLFVATINIGNSYNERKKGDDHIEQTVSSLAINHQYFHFYAVWTDTQKGLDFGSTAENLEQLLFDMTGVSFTAERIHGGDLSASVVKKYAWSFINRGYLIGYDGSHFFNITGVGKMKDGRIPLEIFDPYLRDQEKVYYLDELQGLYVITEEK